MKGARKRRNTRQSRCITARAPRNRKRPNYLLLTCVFMVAAAMSGAAAFALRTPALAVREVTIKGVKLADRAAVEKIAAQALGRSVLVLRKSPILAGIRGVSEIREVKIGRRLPDKVWVRVWEREPDVVLADGANWWLMQSDGFVFHRARGPVSGVPVMRVYGCEPVKLGEIAESPRVRYGLEALTCAGMEGIKLGKISVDPQGDICLNMGSDFYVKLGQPDDIAIKMSKLRRALAYDPTLAKKAQYLDISCPDALAFMPKVVAQAAP